MPKYTKPTEDDSQILRDYYATMNNKADFFVNSNNISEIYNTKTSAPKDFNAVRSPFEVLQEFSENVMPLIIECWLEANPNMIHGQQDSNNLYCMELLLDILQKLFSALGQHFTEYSGGEFQPAHQEYFEKYQKDIHRYFMNHFPYTAVVSDAKTDEMMLSINVYLCIIMSVYFHQLEDDAKMENWMSNVVDWMTQVLSGKNDGESTGRYSNAVNTKLALLLPVITKLLPVLPSEEYRYDLLQSFNTFYSSCHAQSAIKQHCLHFIADILVPEPGSPSVEVDPDLSRDWLLSFPKLLWQLQTNNLQTTSFLISTLSKYLRKYSGHQNQAAELTTLQSALIPFFFTIMKQKKDKKESRIFGPFIRLPVDLQLQCLRLLYYLPQWSTNLLRALVAIVPHVESQVVTHLLELASLRSEDRSAEDSLSFLFTVLVTNAAEKPKAKEDTETISIDTKRVHKLDAVVDAVTHNFPLLDDSTSPLSVSEQLLSQLTKSEFQFGLHHSLIRLILASSLKYSNGVYHLTTSQIIPASIYKALPGFILDYLKQIMGQEYEEDCLDTLRKLFLQIPEIFSKLLKEVLKTIPGKDTTNLILFLDDLVNNTSMQEMLANEQVSLTQNFRKSKATT